MGEKMKKFEERGRKFYYTMQYIFLKMADVLEMIAAILVSAAIIMALLKLIPEIGALWKSGVNYASFQGFLEETLAIVIGIEFLKMLFRPSSDNVLETIIFLVARHMIVSKTTPFEDLISTISIVLLVLVKKYLADNKTAFRIKKKDESDPVEEEVPTCHAD